MTPGAAPDATRAKLLAAAAEEIVARGYTAASLSRTAERIGLTKGAFSRHFPTKDDLVEAIIAEAARRGPGLLRDAQDAFPASPLRACIYAVGEISAAGRTDPVLAASLLLVQDPAIDARRVAPLRRMVADVLRVPLTAAVAEEGYDLTLPVEDAVQFLVVLLTGILSSARFADDFGPQHEVLSVQAALAGLGIPDAAEVVADVIRRLGA
ncbi:DNA-binding transcriptional repressor AcrR [Microbacterium azadirachtae]|uniref:DNA-binding transcriptional repressor AcrR n=1 Tax=Microbacterium azadirachtae TaxID=582680 RepID=A0A0F0KIS8_9MICO|nr:TetR/AcrR family transcriptional regulator [Microbacterium azadirachtae]KJL20763.1 DNA-binding transcriptional repressor AcrR [Microbacterium azadirachtae]